MYSFYFQVKSDRISQCETWHWYGFLFCTEYWIFVLDLCTEVDFCFIGDFVLSRIG